MEVEFSVLNERYIYTILKLVKNNVEFDKEKMKIVDDELVRKYPSIKG